MLIRAQKIRMRATAEMSLETVCDLRRAALLPTKKRGLRRGPSLEPNRVATVVQAREVLEVYHAHPPVGCLSFRRLVGVYGSGPVRPAER